jgi:hypothetical protein
MPQRGCGGAGENHDARGPKPMPRDLSLIWSIVIGIK